MGQTWGAGVQRVTRWCGCRPLDGTMGTTIGSGRVLEAHRNETVWLQQMQEEEGLSTFSRGSGPRRPKSSQHHQQLLAVKESLEKLVPGVAENGSVSCGTQSQAAAVLSLPASPTEFPRMSGNLPCSGKLVPVVEIGVSDQQSAEKCLVVSKASTGPLFGPVLLLWLGSLCALNLQQGSDKISGVKGSEEGWVSIVFFSP
ncbi:uncharacterized protein [Notamacropus eugenii]|uniref:uncharacterized protein isoform X2 n=1 Tax=Notamacropus eugenii TaxID=9315 RepID=UPI003B67EA59